MTTAAFTYNGQDLGALYGLILERRRLALIPKAMDRAVHVPSRPGSHDFGTDLFEREITLECFFNQASRANLESAISNVARAFDPTNEAGTDRGFKQLIFDTLSDRYFLAKLSGMPIPDLSVTTGRVTLLLRCADPFAYATSQTVTTGATAQTAGVDVGLIDVGLIDLAPLCYLDVTVGGTYVADAVIDVTMAAAYTGALIVSNESGTGQILSWLGTLAAGDVLRVDGTTLRVYVNGITSMSGVVAGSKWPQLLAGQVNRIQVAGPAPSFISSITVTHRGRWI